jgi:hypothetical protein
MHLPDGVKDVNVFGSEPVGEPNHVHDGGSREK